MNIETTEYLLPDFWASALINGDESGMKDDDIAAMNKWFDSRKPGYCVDCSDESEFTTWHDARAYVLACDCLTYTFHKGIS
jgi:hypothetical protein